MIFAWDFTENFIRPLSKWGGFFFLILGIMWIIYALYETKRRGSFKKRKVQEWDFDVTKFLKGLTYIGFLVGIFSMMSGIGQLILDEPPSVAYATANPGAGRSLFSAILLIVFGIFTFLKPLNDLPIASVVGLLVALTAAIFVCLIIPGWAVEHIAIHFDPKWFFIILFIIIFAVVAILVKFYIGGLMGVSKVVSWPPFAFIVAVVCLIQGFLLLVVGIGISGYF
ncbi:MAG: hypothetical protein ACFE91_08770 [Promethearchaeota archaeon]